MRNVLLVALGGAFGAVVRYGLALAAARLYDGPAPLGTWLANALGCLLIGVASGWMLARDPGTAWKLLVVTGFLGAFTTFSTYSLDTLVLWQRGLVGWALVNAAGSVLVGLVAVMAGLRLGTWWAS